MQPYKRTQNSTDEHLLFCLSYCSVYLIFNIYEESFVTVFIVESSKRLSVNIRISYFCVYFISDNLNKFTNLNMKIKVYLNSIDWDKNYYKRFICGVYDIWRRIVFEQFGVDFN